MPGRSPGRKPAASIMALTPCTHLSTRLATRLAIHLAAWPPGRFAAWLPRSRRQSFSAGLPAAGRQRLTVGGGKLKTNGWRPAANGKWPGGETGSRAGSQAGGQARAGPGNGGQSSFWRQHPFTLALLLYFPKKHKIMTLGGELRGARILPYGGWDCEQLVASAPVYGSVKYQEY